MRFLGIDPGTRRVGLAQGDELGLATPLPALLVPEPERWERLGEIIARLRITDLVLGLPLNMDDTRGPKALEAEVLARRLNERFGLPVHLVDERLTSHEAEQGLTVKERRSLRSSGVIDSRAAAILLQDFLNERFPPPAPTEDGTA